MTVTVWGAFQLVLVKVSEDGQTAVLSTPYVIAGVNDKGEGRVSTGGYRAFYKKTSEGWEIAELYAISDNPVVSQGCDVNGPMGIPTLMGLLGVASCAVL